MKLARIFFVVVAVAGSAWAQDKAPAKPAPKPLAATPAATREMRHRLGLAATRAIANFHSADTIEERLRAEGQTLHPELARLRLNIESELDEADSAINRGDLTGAAKAIDRAQAFLDRFAARLGGA